MDNAAYEMTIHRGANYILPIYVVDQDDNAVALTGGTAVLEIKRSNTATSNILSISTTDYILITEAAGLIYIDIPASITGAITDPVDDAEYKLFFTNDAGSVELLFSGPARII